MADKPGHLLEIPASLGRDVDKARAGKIPPPPVEAFLSQQTLSAIEQSSSSAIRPVHAETLVPMSKSQAADRTVFDGKQLPAMPATRRVIPAPFRRTRIEAGRHGKRWQYVRAGQVAVGDILPEVGRVIGVQTDIRRQDISTPAQVTPGVAVGTDVTVVGAGGNTATFPDWADVRVFR